MKQTIYILLLILLPCVGYADKKEGKKNISQIKTYLKSGKDFDKAEELARKTIAMPEYQEDIDVRLLLVESIQKQYEAKNMQLYLKNLTDTASIFPLARRMFVAFEGLDSLEQKPDKKDRVIIKYRKKNSEYLNRYRPNLLSGGLFSLRHNKYQEALDCAAAYLDCERQPLFSEMNYAEKDSLRSEAAYVALSAAYRLKRHDMMVKYADLALQHPLKARYALVDLYNDELEQKDTLKAVSYLHQGFDRFPEFSYYFPRLVDYYMAKNNLDTVTVMVNRALEVEPGNQFYRLALNTLQLNSGKYDECILLGDSLIHTNDKMTVAHFNVGSSYYNKALQLNKSIDNARSKGQVSKAKKLIAQRNAIYKQALPYLERYRQMRPKSANRWAQILYTIYLDLNMGKEFEEIEELLTDTQKKQ